MGRLSSLSSEGDRHESPYIYCVQWGWEQSLVRPMYFYTPWTGPNVWHPEAGERQEVEGVRWRWCRWTRGQLHLSRSSPTSPCSECTTAHLSWRQCIDSVDHDGASPRLDRVRETDVIGDLGIVRVLFALGESKCLDCLLRVSVSKCVSSVHRTFSDSTLTCVHQDRGSGRNVKGDGPSVRGNTSWCHRLSSGSDAVPPRASRPES